MTTNFPILTGQNDAARYLVERYHYSGRFPQPLCVVTAHEPHGGLLGIRGEAVGAVLFTRSNNRNWKGMVIELSRLVRRPDATDLSLSWLVAVACKQLKQSVSDADLLISYADNTRGHHGGIYQACSWNYHGFRSPTVDGIMVDDTFIPKRTASVVFGHFRLNELREERPGNTIVPHVDEGRFLYWRALNKRGQTKAMALGLTCRPYPKPDQTTDED